MSILPKLVTKRCSLKHISEDNMPILKEIFEDTETKKFLPELYPLIDANDGFHDFISAFDSYAENGDGYLLGINCDDKLLGFVAVMDLSDSPALFYAMHRESRSQGYMKEAISAVLDYLVISGLCSCISTEVYKDNGISIHILQVLGFIIYKEDDDKVYLSKQLPLHLSYFCFVNDSFISVFSSIGEKTIMGIFKSTKLFCDVSHHCDAVANSIMSSMRYDGYEVDGVKLPSGDWDISIKKGALFKAVLGLQTALKIKISPTAPHAYVKAGVGIFGQQAIPTILTVCVGWPFAIPQIWGIIKQSKLDSIVMEKIQNEFDRLAGHPVTSRVID